MIVKLKKKTLFGSKKEAHNVNIDKFEIEQDAISGNEILKVYFRGTNSSGIIELTKLNVYQMFGAIKRRR